ncbi:DUF559 domain-containing protein [Amycolatopsis sp. NBC_00355]|uniref:endonuclease domain-containing protein n=1 Tax=Amycolatopsis sp. NBC_00355 TaxID=2975957 RepID=UPI002E2705F6
MGQRAVRQALASGLLAQPWRGVVVPAADSLKLATRAEAALLLAGQPAVLSGATSLALHGISAAETADIHLTVPYERRVRSKPGLIVHQRDYQQYDVLEIDGLPTFSVDLALADFLCRGDKRTAFASVEEAMRGLPPDHLQKLRDNVRDRIADRSSRKGIHRALSMLALADGRAESPPESMLKLIVTEAGLPVPETQYVINDIDGRLLYVLDMAWPARRVALEYDGFAAHEERQAADAERDRRMLGRGWITVRAVAADLRDPSRVLRELREAFRACSG